jgi:hypothetical protein
VVSRSKRLGEGLVSQPDPLGSALRYRIASKLYPSFNYSSYCWRLLRKARYFPYAQDERCQPYCNPSSKKSKQL